MMAYQYGGVGGQYGSRTRYPVASGAFNPRSPPNVVPTASLVQMTPGTSLRSFATQGGHGLPPAYPFQQGQESRSPVQPPPLIHNPHHDQPAPGLSPASISSPSAAMGVSGSGDSQMSPLRLPHHEMQMSLYPRAGYSASGMGVSPMPLVMGAPNQGGHVYGMSLPPVSPTGNGPHSSPPMSPHGYHIPGGIPPSHYDHRMGGLSSHGQTPGPVERDRHSFLYPNVSGCMCVVYIMFVIVIQYFSFVGNTDDAF